MKATRTQRRRAKQKAKRAQKQLSNQLQALRGLEEEPIDLKRQWVGERLPGLERHARRLVERSNSQRVWAPEILEKIAGTLDDVFEGDTEEVQESMEEIREVFRQAFVGTIKGVRRQLVSSIRQTRESRVR